MRARALARLVRAFVPGWLRRPAGPTRAVVALTRRCDLRCRFCHTWQLEPGQEMTADEVGRLCQGMPGLTWLDLTGGEPFLRPDIEDVFARVLEQTPRLSVLHFPTNGSFADRAIACARLARRWRPEVSLLITVSIDGPPALHDALRGRDGSYRAALHAFEALRRVEGVQAYIGTTVGPDNVDALGELERALADDVRDWSPGLWHWNLGQVSSHFFGNEADDVALPPARAAALVREQLARRWPPRGAVDLMELGFLAVLPGWLEGHSTGLTCPALHSTCFVSADAQLYPCHVWDRALADLREVDFDVERAWASDEVARARCGVKRLDCGDCFTPCEAYPRLAASPVRAPIRLLRAGLGRRCYTGTVTSADAPSRSSSSSATAGSTP